MKKRGIGFACSAQGANYHFGHEDKSTVELQVQQDNSILIRTAASDLGQGLEAALCKIVSISFNDFPLEKIFWEGSNSLSPDAGSTGASRQTTVTGNALYQACSKLKSMIRSVAAEHYDCHPDKITFRGEQIQVAENSTSWSEIREIFDQMGLALNVLGVFTAPKTTPLSEDGKGYPINQIGYAAHIAEVEVDTVTGEVSVLRVKAYHDAGRILDPIGASAQVEGALVMGMGFALFEEYLLDQGKPVNVGFTNYLIPSLADIPEIQVNFLTMPAEFGKLGVKGLAEAPVTTIAPAIINAIYDAVGVRITHLPATPNRVLDALLDSKNETE